MQTEDIARTLHHLASGLGSSEKVKRHGDTWEIRPELRVGRWKTWRRSCQLRGTGAFMSSQDPGLLIIYIITKASFSWAEFFLLSNEVRYRVGMR